MDILIQGLLLGGLYCLFSLGLSLMFGVMRLTNIAQGDFIIAAGFAAVSLAPLFDGQLLLTGLALLPLAFAAGYLVQRSLLNRTLGKDPLPSLVVTFGLSIVIQNLLQELYSANPRALEVGALSTDNLALGGTVVGTLPLLILLAALLATAGLQLLFARTAIGRAFRAVSDDREVAELMGLRASRVYATATALAFALIALAGVFQAMRTTVAPSDGPMLLLFAFEAVIIGGMGSFWGTFVGAMALGLSQQAGFSLDPGWGVWFGHLVFLAVLLLRPNGLFPKTRG